MANTYSQIYIQIVFSTKGRLKLIHSNIREKIEKYINGIIANKKQKLYAIYCMPDHIHLLISIKPNINISDLVKEIKTNSTKYINDNKLTIDKFNWQDGYSVFSYSQSSLKKVVNYILNQEEHHKIKSFKEEYIEFLKINNIEFDEQYTFDKI